MSAIYILISFFIRGILVIIAYCFLASNIAGPVGSTIGSILVLIIVSIVCCITVVALGKKRKRQNAIICNTQQFELETIGSLEITETLTQTGSSRLLPKVRNTTLNTIPYCYLLYEL